MKSLFDKKYYREQSASAKEKKEKKKKGFSLKSKPQKDGKKSPIFYILGIIMVILLIAVLLRKSQGSTDIPTFSGFLKNVLGQAPLVKIPFLNFTSQTLGDWGFLNFFRDFIAFNIQIVDVLIFFINGIVSIISYIVYIFQWLYGF